MTNWLLVNHVVVYLFIELVYADLYTHNITGSCEVDLVTKKINQTASLTCYITNYDKEVTGTWSVHDSEWSTIRPNARAISPYISGQQSISKNFRNANIFDIGRYTCRIYDKHKKEQLLEREVDICISEKHNSKYRDCPLPYLKVMYKLRTTTFTKCSDRCVLLHRNTCDQECNKTQCLLKSHSCNGPSGEDLSQRISKIYILLLNSQYLKTLVYNIANGHNSHRLTTDQLVKYLEFYIEKLYNMNFKNHILSVFLTAENNEFIDDNGQRYEKVFLHLDCKPTSDCGDELQIITNVVQVIKEINSQNKYFIYSITEMRPSKTQCEYTITATEEDNHHLPEDSYRNNSNQTASGNEMGNFFSRYTTLIAVISLISILGIIIAGLGISYAINRYRIKKQGFKQENMGLQERMNNWQSQSDNEYIIQD